LERKEEFSKQCLPMLDNPRAHEPKTECPKRKKKYDLMT
jgi:hypothetical protein